MFSGSSKLTLQVANDRGILVKNKMFTFSDAANLGWLLRVLSGSLSVRHIGCDSTPTCMEELLVTDHSSLETTVSETHPFTFPLKSTSNQGPPFYS